MTRRFMILLIAILPILAACERTETTATDTGTVTVVDTAPVPLNTTMADAIGTAATGTAGPGTATRATATNTAGGTAAGAADRNVHVTLAEYRIEMPDTLPPGPVTFHVVNSGRQEHNFEIEGQGIEKKLDSNLQAGETGTLNVDLQRGPYKIYCPVGDHEQRGMTRQLTVQ